MEVFRLFLISSLSACCQRNSSYLLTESVFPSAVLDSVLLYRISSIFLRRLLVVGSIGQVVPDPLLDFCFNVMRSALSVTLNRPVYAFKFDRFMEVTPAILEKVDYFIG